MKIGDLIEPAIGWSCMIDTFWMLGERVPCGLVLEVSSDHATYGMIRVFFPSHNKFGWVRGSDDDFTVIASL